MLKKLFKRKQVISARSVLDLRDYTPEALNGIKSIEAVATLILPENPTPEFMEAFSKIHLDAVGGQFNVAKDKKIVTINGIKNSSDISLPNNCFAVMIGIIILGRPIKGENIEYALNGIVLKKKGIQNEAKCVAENGIVYEMDFDEDKMKFFSNKVEVDADFIRNLEVGTLVAAGNTITISADVTEEAIVNNDIKFFAGNSINCSKSIKSCVQARSVVGNKIDVTGK